MFAVLADSRTGSHLLRTLLNSHPRLHCFDEILGFRKSEKDFYKLGKHEGCLISYANIVAGNEFAQGNNIKRIISILRTKPVIHLTRDLSERAKSQLFYSQTKARFEKESPFRKANLEADVRFEQREEDVDAVQLAKIEKMFQERKDACLAALAPVPEHWLNISYEWLCGDEQLKQLDDEKAKVLCDYLQVRMVTMTTNLYKIRKFDPCQA